jgi:CheY-like chemotaxis protein
LGVVTDERRTTVLIADDDEDMRVLVRLNLELSGRIEVVAEAIDGIDALDSFVRLDPPPVPQVVLLDNRMPGMTGLEVAAFLLERVPVQRIILFSAYLDDATVAQARNLGITEVVSKDEVSDLADIILRVQDSEG